MSNDPAPWDDIWPQVEEHQRREAERAQRIQEEIDALPRYWDVPHDLLQRYRKVSER